MYSSILKRNVQLYFKNAIMYSLIFKCYVQLQLKTLYTAML